MLSVDFARCDVEYFAFRLSTNLEWGEFGARTKKRSPSDYMNAHCLW
jgi:hypothetical protein